MLKFFNTSNLQFPNESSNKVNSVFRKDSFSSPMFLLHSHYVVHCSESVAGRLNQEMPIASLGLAEKVLRGQVLEAWICKANLDIW